MDRAGAKILLVEIYHAALAAVAPGPALIRALQHEPADDRVWLIALGKAAAPMAEAAVRILRDRGRAPVGGLIVAPDAAAAPHPSLVVAVGDHPEPAAGSIAAADALGRLVSTIPPGDTVWVLLSGGTTSLIGAPQPGIAADELKALYGQLLRSGLDIKEMNRVRKRFTRWGGGRLAWSLAHARVRCYIVSDVVGDDLAAIGSGPCAPDPFTAQDVRDALVRASLWDELPPSLRQHLDAIERGHVPETPKPGDPVFAQVESTLIATNRLALESASRKSISRRFDQVLNGTGTTPTAAAPRQSSTHSMRLLISMPMRSPRHAFTSAKSAVSACSSRYGRPSNSRTSLPSATSVPTPAGV